MSETAKDTHSDAHHVELPFWRKYIFSTDHKIIGFQYLFTGLFFLFFGFSLMMLMRWQLAYPEKAVPVIGGVLASIFEKDMAGGVVQPQFYNTLGAMHGTIMVFMAIVPIAFGAFANFVLPLQIGAPDMAFPKINAASYWCYFVGSVIMAASFFLPGGAAKSGWTSYSPLASLEDPGWLGGQTWWLIGMIYLITSSLLAAVNFITTIVQLRAPGMTWSRLPVFIWAQLVTSFLLLLAFPPLEVAGILQLMDRVAGTSFFLPSGLMVGGDLMRATAGGDIISGGGTVILWQHLFWFLGHPEVYVLILPALGIVAELVACNSRKPLMGYKPIVFSIFAVGFLSFIVWAHHMYMTGMGAAISAFFQTTTIIISIPSMIILTMFFLSLWGGSIRFNTPMLFTLGFLLMFGIGGLTGIPLAFNAPDLYLHDTYYIIGHFHYVVAPGTIFGLFAGIYHWYPKATGRAMCEKLGKIHFWGSLVCMNIVFAPMFIQGMGGVGRRWWDGGASYEFAKPFLHWNEVMSWGAWALALFQIPFIINFFMCLKKGEKVSDNHWGATTLDWTIPNCPPHGNFLDSNHHFVAPEVHRGPYEYSVPGEAQDFSPQNKKPVTSPADAKAKVEA